MANLQIYFMGMPMAKIYVSIHKRVKELSNVTQLTELVQIQNSLHHLTASVPAPLHSEESSV